MSVLKGHTIIAHHFFKENGFQISNLFVRMEGLGPATHRLKVYCSTRLSYIPINESFARRQTYHSQDHNGPSGDRTHDSYIKSVVLYQLSYWPKASSLTQIYASILSWACIHLFTKSIGFEPISAASFLAGIPTNELFS